MNFLRWLYTDYVELLDFYADDDDDDEDGDGVEDTISMFKASRYYELPTLFERCERAILDRVVVTSCVKFHNVATEVGSTPILNLCQQMITSYWNGLEPQDFRQMDCDSSLCEMEVSILQYPHLTLTHDTVTLNAFIWALFLWKIHAMFICLSVCFIENSRTSGPISNDLCV